MFNKNLGRGIEPGLIHLAKYDSKAFGELYRLYVERVFKYCYGKLENVAQAEDATAQTFLVAFETIDRLRDEKYFSSWLFSIARNKAMDAFRKQRKLVPLNESLLSQEETDPINIITQSTQIDELSTIIAKLPEKEKELLRLRFLAELSYVEIARLLHRNEQGVKKSVYRLLHSIHGILEVSDD